MKLAGCMEGGDIKKPRWSRKQQEEHLYRFIQDRHLIKTRVSSGAAAHSFTGYILHLARRAPLGSQPILRNTHVGFVFPLRHVWLFLPEKLLPHLPISLRASGKFCIVGQMTQKWGEPVQERSHCWPLLIRTILWRSGFQIKDNLGAIEELSPLDVS